MRCRTVRETLDAHAANELTARVQDQIETHLESCEACRQSSARLRQLAVFLESASAPPAVPEGFAKRVMARARQRIAAGQPVTRRLWNPLRWWGAVSLPMRAGAAAALILGLAIGMLMGQQTWLHAAEQSGAAEREALAGPVAVYSLDYLDESPNGSLAQAYLTLTAAPNSQGE